MTATPGTVVMFYDYDTQWGADRSRSPGGPKSWGADEFEATDRILELHDRYAVPACFAVVGAAALPGRRPYHDPAQIRRIASCGHEVASHSFRHEWLPGLGPDELRETLVRSRAALEDCVGAPVVTFVPPFNQPFDYPRRWSFSLSERRAARGRPRIDIPRLCRALAEAGYRVSRISYRSIAQRAAERVVRRSLDRPGAPERIGDIMCLRVNAPCGFGAETLRCVERCAERGGMVVVYAHPHSLDGGGPQDRRWLVPFLERVGALQREGRLRVAQPREFAEG